LNANILKDKYKDNYDISIFTGKEELNLEKVKEIDPEYISSLIGHGLFQGKSMKIMNVWFFI